MSGKRASIFDAEAELDVSGFTPEAGSAQRRGPNK